MAHPRVTIGCVSNVYIRLMHFEKVGDCEITHEHPFDHITYVAAGSVQLTVNNEDTIYRAPSMILIEAGLLHKLTALEDNTSASCIHALRVGERVEDILDPAMVPKGVNPAAISRALLSPRK